MSIPSEYRFLRMSKKQALQVFGSDAALAQATKCSLAEVAQWIDPLPLHIGDKILGAAIAADMDVVAIWDDCAEAGL